MFGGFRERFETVLGDIALSGIVASSKSGGSWKFCNNLSTHHPGDRMD